MRVEVITMVHQLTAACKKCKGITFTNNDDNFIKDDEDTTDDASDNLEITRVDRGNNEIDESNNQTLETTGVT